MGKGAPAPSPVATGLLPLTEGQLLTLSMKELRGMNLGSLLDTLQQLGHSTETIKTRTQALTSLADSIVGAEMLEEAPEE